MDSCGGAQYHRTDLDQARRRLREEGLEAELKRSDMTVILYPDFFFDAVISTHVIYHTTLETMRKTTSEIHRVLSKSGLVFLTFQSKRSHKFGKEKNNWRVYFTLI